MKRMSSCHKDGSIILSMCSIISTIFFYYKVKIRLNSRARKIDVVFYLDCNISSAESYITVPFMWPNSPACSSTILENLSRKLFSVDPKFKASGDKKRCHFWLSIIEAGDLGHNKTIWISTCRLSNHLFTTYNVVITCNRGTGSDI